MGFPGKNHPNQGPTHNATHPSQPVRGPETRTTPNTKRFIASFFFGGDFPHSKIIAKSHYSILFHDYSMIIPCFFHVFSMIFPTATSSFSTPQETSYLSISMLARSCYMNAGFNPVDANRAKSKTEPFFGRA